MKKHLAKSLAFLLIISAFILSCQKSELVDTTTLVKSETEGFVSLKSTISFCGDPLIADMVDYQMTITPGIVTIGNDAAKLYVTYNLTGDWWIKNAVLFVGPASVAGIIHPDGTGEFAPWLWVSPYRHDFWPWPYTAQSYTFEIDLSSLDECFVVVAYANANNIITNEEKYIWGKSPDPSKFLGYYLQYCKQLCSPPLNGCGTGYAYGNTYANCFMTIPGLNSNNWGWSNGLIGAGNYVWPIYANAGQCLIENGTHVGNLLISYNPPSATVTYSLFNGYVLQATHLYIGNQILPMKKNKYTTAPGQFPYKHDNLIGVQSDTYTINNLSGNIFVVAHSDVCDE